MSSFWTYWYFHIPNFILAAVMYTMLGRLLLGFFVAEDWDNYIWRFFKKVTDPVANLVRLITPQVLSMTIVVSLMTKAPSQEMQDMIEEIRVPRGNTIMVEKTA